MIHNSTKKIIIRTFRCLLKETFSKSCPKYFETDNNRSNLQMNLIIKKFLINNSNLEIHLIQIIFLLNKRWKWVKDERCFQKIGKILKKNDHSKCTKTKGFYLYLTSYDTNPRIVIKI